MELFFFAELLFVDDLAGYFRPFLLFVQTFLAGPRDRCHDFLFTFFKLVVFTPLISLFTLPKHPERIKALSRNSFACLSLKKSFFSFRPDWSNTIRMTATIMHLLFSLVLLLSLTYSALTTPTACQPQRQTRSFKVERIKRSDYVAHGPTALRKALRKFGITPMHFAGIDLDDFELYDPSPASTITTIRNSEHVDQEGSVSATSVQGDLEFVSPVIIGGQNITMDFDTGSSDM